MRSGNQDQSERGAQDASLHLEEKTLIVHRASCLRYETWDGVLTYDGSI